jgi:hypothetical protein
MRKHYFIIMFVLLISPSISWATTIAVDLPLAIQSSPAKTSFAEANILGGIRLWWNRHGIESFSGTFFDYQISRVRYLFKINENIYGSAGAGEVKYKTTGWGVGFPTPPSSVAEYKENTIYFSFGAEQSLIFDWLVSNYEVGYIFSSVSDFSGDQSKRPGSRLYVAGGLGIRIKI